MANSFAYFMILFWPVVSLILFLTTPRPWAIIWTIIAGYVLLPASVAIDLPLIPLLAKSSTPTYAAFPLAVIGLGASFTRRSDPTGETVPLPGWLPKSFIGTTLVLAATLGSMPTALTNMDTFWVGDRLLPALRLHEAFSFFFKHALLVLPLLLGRRYLASTESHRRLLLALTITGLALSLPALLEVRLSPQIHTWIYGFFPHDFIQVRRFGGWRPQVLFEHGLRFAIFMAMCLLAAAALLRVKMRYKWLRALAVSWLSAVLVLCKSLAAIIFAAVLLPIAILFGRRLQMLTAVIIALTTLLYPALRSTGVLTEPVIRSVIDPVDVGNRYASLKSRLVNEDMLLAHAADRPVFGWGTFGRHRVYDPVTGQDVTVTDGIWIIVFTQHGWVGYIAIFGLLSSPIILLYFKRKYTPPIETTGLCLVLSINLLDMLPNSSLMPMSMLIAGALYGAHERERSARRSMRPTSDGARLRTASRSGYSETGGLRPGPRTGLSLREAETERLGPGRPHVPSALKRARRRNM